MRTLTKVPVLLANVPVLLALILCAGCTATAAVPSSTGRVSTPATAEQGPQGGTLPIISARSAVGHEEVTWRFLSRSGNRVQVSVSFGCSGPPIGAWLAPQADRVRLHIVAGPAPAIDTPCLSNLVVGYFTVVLPTGDGARLLLAESTP